MCASSICLIYWGRVVSSVPPHLKQGREIVCGSTVSSCVCKKHSKRRSCIETALARLVQPGSIVRDAIVHISPPLPPTRL